MNNPAEAEPLYHSIPELELERRNIELQIKAQRNDYHA